MQFIWLFKLLCATSLVLAPNPANPASKEVIALLKLNIKQPGSATANFAKSSSSHDLIPLLNGQEKSTGWPAPSISGLGSSPSRPSGSSSPSIDVISTLPERNGLKSSADGHLVYPREYQLVDDTYVLPKDWKITASKIPLPPGLGAFSQVQSQRLDNLPPGFHQTEPYGHILPAGYKQVGSYILPEDYSVDETGTILPPGWKSGGVNAYAIPSNWKTKIEKGVKITVPPKRSWPNRGKFPEGWKKDPSLKKYYLPGWDRHTWVHLPLPLGTYPSDILKEVTTATGSKMLIPKYWEYRKGRVIPWGMKMTDNEKVIPRDWLFDPSTNHILPSKLSLQKFLELDGQMKFTDDMVEKYFIQRNNIVSRDEGQLVKQLVEAKPTPRLKTILGSFHIYGIAGFNQDYGTAISLFQEALNDPRANHFLGMMYLDGLGVTQNSDLAIEYLKKAASKGNSYSFYQLGIIYDKGSHGIKMDKAKVIDYYQKASLKGYGESTNSLGIAYELGNYGLVKNSGMALHYYLKAADQGEAWGFVNLGRYYQNGDVVAFDLEQAKQYYRIAAEMGNQEVIRYLMENPLISRR